MKYLKLFENIEPYRDVDLQQLLNDYNKYKRKLYSVERHYGDFADQVITPLLLNKKVDFGRYRHPYDDEIGFVFRGGIIKKISTGLSSLHKDFTVFVTLNDDDKLYILAQLERDNSKHVIVRIYDSEELPIETELDMLKKIETYNL